MQAVCYPFILGFEIKAAIKPKSIAAPTPPAVAFMPPVKIPIKPDSSTAFIVPFASEYPKSCKGNCCSASANIYNFLIYS